MDHLKSIYFRINFLICFPIIFGIEVAGNAAPITTPHASQENENHVHGAHKECQLPRKTQDIVDCVLIRSPDVARQKIKIDTSIGLIDKASQRPNPEISTRYVAGYENQDYLSEIETNLAFTIELNNKRETRRSVAKASQNVAEVSLQDIKSKVKIKTILILYRLKQLIVEKKMLIDSMAAINKVIVQLKKRSRLSPGQEASLIIFDIALEEAKVQFSEFLDEERKIEHYIHVNTGHSLNEISAFLPSMPGKWPNINHHGDTSSRSLHIAKLNSIAEKAKMELKKQQADSWSDMKIGPALSYESKGTKSNVLIGFNFHLPLPLFHSNEGGQKQAMRELIGARENIALSLAEESHERREQVKNYQSAVKILQDTHQIKKINRFQTKIEKLYERGVVSSSVFLDSMSQRRIYLTSRHRREMAALKALWQVYYYDGKVLETNL